MSYEDIVEARRLYEFAKAEKERKKAEKEKKKVEKEREKAERERTNAESGVLASWISLLFHT
jgi:hypothetical protein